MRSAVLLVLLVSLMFTDARSPCERSSNNNAYNQFRYKHILSYDFDTDSQDAWAKYLLEKGLCGRRPIQSFLRKNNVNSIINICNGKGIRDRDNLCTSKDKFTVYTVQSKEYGNQCRVFLEAIERYVVVACDVIDNQCLPVHYETQTDTPPDQNGWICQPTRYTLRNRFWDEEWLHNRRHY